MNVKLGNIPHETYTWKPSTGFKQQKRLCILCSLKSGYIKHSKQHKITCLTPRLLSWIPFCIQRICTVLCSSTRTLPGTSWPVLWTSQQLLLNTATERKNKTWGVAAVDGVLSRFATNGRTHSWLYVDSLQQRYTQQYLQGAEDYSNSSFCSFQNQRSAHFNDSRKVENFHHLVKDYRSSFQ